jgi:hypothetical protein
MEKDEKVLIQVSENCSELVIRHGDAKEIKPTEPIVICGSIEAPMTFLNARMKSFRASDSIVIINRGEMEVLLNFNEDKQFGNVFEAVITGKLAVNPDVIKIGLNGAKTFGLTDLSDHLKRNRYFFLDKEENAKIVSELRAFKAKTTVDLNQEVDKRGNHQSSVDKRVNSNVPMKFTLDMPVFVGGPKRRFEVEICIESRDVSVSVWLESPELQDIILQERDLRFSELVTKLSANGELAIIEV